MDFKTLRPSHRHFVAAPLVLLVAILTLGVQDSPLWRASVVETSRIITIKVGEEQALHGGVRVAGGEEGASLEIVDERAELLRGSVLLKAQGVYRLTAEPWTLTVLDGAAFVERSPSGVLSVAAITSNVLAEDDEGRGVLIPVSKQWKSTEEGLSPLEIDPLAWGAAAAIQDIPQTFFREQRRVAQGMAGAVLPAATSTVPDLTGSPWMLPSAQSRSLERKGGDVFGYIRSLLGGGEWQTLQAYLSRQETREFLQTSPLTRQFFTALALQSSDAQRASLLLLPFLAKDPEAFLLLSLHPVFHRAAWVLAAAPLAGEKQLILLVSTPRADILADPFADAVYARWLKAAQEAVDAAPFPQTLVQLLLEDGVNVLRGLRERGYLHRLVRYAEGYRSLAAAYADASEEVQAALSTIRAMAMEAKSSKESVVIEEEPVTPAAPAAVPDVRERVLTDGELRSLTYMALRDAGALFTVRTEIRLLTTGKAAVEGIIFGTTAYSFEFDPVTRTVERIVRGTTALPFSLPFEKFVAWAKE